METERLMRQEIESRVAEGGVRGMNAHARDVWGRGYPSRKRGFLKSPAILASKARLRRRRAARVQARFVDEGRNNVDRPRYLAWNRMAIPEIDERVARGDLGVLSVPTYDSLADGHRW